MANQRLRRSKEEIRIYIKKHKKLIGIYAAISAGIAGFFNGYTVAMQRCNAGIIREVPKNPLKLLYYGTLFEGSTMNFFVFFLLIFGIVFYLKVILDKKDANIDERNFVVSKSGVYGTSHEMDEEERDIILHADKDPENMTNGILGRDRVTGECLEVKPDLPPQLRLGVHKFVAGTTGKRKSRSQVIPDIFQQIKRGESFVCTDPKGELYELTSVLAREEGYIVKVFNLVNTINSDSCAFLKLVGKNTMMAQTMAEVLVANSTEGATKDGIWQKGEKALIAFGILAIAMDKNIPDEEKTLYAVYDYLVNQDIEEIEEKAENMPITNPAKKQWNIFKTSPEKVRDGIRTNLATDLQLMMEPTIQAITSYDEIDLEMPGRKKCAYYVIMSDQEDTLNYFSAIFFSFMFIKLVKYADRRPSKKCRVPVNLMLDEFPNIGKLPGFKKKLNTIRSRDIRCTIIVQDLGQLMDMYEGHTWESIIGACDTQILLGLNDTATNAEWWSKQTGTMTVEVDSTKHEKHLLRPVNLQTTEQETEGKGKRPVMMPDEIRYMPTDQSLVFLSGYHFLKVRKFDYTEHPFAERISPLNPSLHEPDWWVKVKDEEWFQDQLDELEEEKRQVEEEEKEFLKELEKETENIKKEQLDADVKNTFAKFHLNPNDTINKVLQIIVYQIRLAKRSIEKKKTSLLEKRLTSEKTIETSKEKDAQPNEEMRYPEITSKKDAPVEEVAEEEKTKEELLAEAKKELERDNKELEEMFENATTEEEPFDDTTEDDFQDVDDFWNEAGEEFEDNYMEEYTDSPYEDQSDAFDDDFFTSEGRDKYTPSKKKDEDFDEVDF